MSENYSEKTESIQHGHHRRAHCDAAGTAQLGHGVALLNGKAAAGAADGIRQQPVRIAGEEHPFARPARIALADCFTPMTLSRVASSVSTGNAS